jgi:tRNA(fMet)-specific endonuclease VapC
MSSVTLAELEYGLHRKGQPVRLRNALAQVLLRMDVLPWDEDVATCYGEFCASPEAQGINLSDFDMMIAAHAVAVNATLVSRDKAFAQLPEQRLRLEIW